MRILVIEDYEPLRHTLVQALSEADYTADATADGEDGLCRALRQPYDAIILDLMLPRRSGHDILAQLRQRGETVPVLVLTARDAVEERVRLLDAGADDYLVKPFALDELLARLRTIIRRAHGHSHAIISIADLDIDMTASTVRRGDQTITLTAREYTLLKTLALHVGEVLSRDELRAHCHDLDQDSDSNVIDVYIGYLRRKLDRPGIPSLIQTRRGLGYVLERP
jgi:DNA-binding response OmpR family regulator